MPDSRPSLLAMRTFEAVARLESVKDAAGELEVTPDAVSQQLRKLEEAVGIELLVRGRRTVTPTTAGRELQQAFEGAFAQLYGALDRVTRQDASTVSIGSAPSFSAKCLLPRLPTLMQAHPEVNVTLLLERDFRVLLRSDFDMAVLFIDQVPSGFESRLIAQEALVPLASPAFVKRHALSTPRDLVSVPLLADDSMRSFPIDEPNWEHWLEAVGLAAEIPECAISFDVSASHAIDAAVGGHGVLLGRKVLAGQDIEGGRLRTLFPPELPMRCAYHLIARAERLEDPAVRHVWDWIGAELLRP